MAPPAQEPLAANTSSSTGENNAPLAVVPNPPIHNRREIRREATIAAEESMQPNPTLVAFHQMQRELGDVPGEEVEVTMGELLDCLAEPQSESGIWGDDVLSTAIRDERDQLRTRVSVLEEQLQAVSETDDPRILGVMLGQTRYTTMKQQRDAYFERVQTLEVEIERLLDYGLGDGGASEQRMRTERDELKYIHDELQYRVDGPDGYLAQIKALQSQIADAGENKGDPFAQLAAVCEELRLERQPANVTQQMPAKLRDPIVGLKAETVTSTATPDEAEFNTQAIGSQTTENDSGINRGRTSEIEDWIHKVQQYANSAPNILIELEDEPSSASQPATREERRGVMAWFTGLVGLANNPPSYPSSPAPPGRLTTMEPPPPDKKNDCPEQLAQARQQLAAAIQDANDIRAAYNALMQQQIRGEDCAQQLEQVRDERDIALQDAVTLRIELGRQVNEALAELDSTRSALVVSSASRDAAIADRDATLMARGRQDDDLTRLRGLMQSNDDNHSAQLAQIQTERGLEIQEVERLRHELLLSLQTLEETQNNPDSLIEEVIRLRNELGEALRGQQPSPPDDDCRERLALAETERDTAVRVQEAIAVSRQEAYTERDLARAERDALAFELDDSNTERASLQADIRRFLQHNEPAMVARSLRLEGERNALVRVVRDRQQPTPEEAVILQDMGLSAAAETTMVNALASEVIDANKVVTDMGRQVERLQAELSNSRRKNPDLPATAPQSDSTNMLPVQVAELAHNATRRRLDQVQGELDRLRNAQAAARIRFDPAVDNPHTLPDVLVLQQLLNTRDERAAQDREELHDAILNNDTARVTLKETRKKLDAVKQQRDRLLAGRGGAQLEDEVDLPRQMEFTAAALERVRQQRDDMLADASVDYSLENNIPARYRRLLAAYDVVLDERNRLERVVAQSRTPREGGEAANSSNGDAESAENRDNTRSDLLQDCADAQQERDAARADRKEAEIQRNSAQAREARTAEELRVATARLETAEEIITGVSAANPRDNLILQLSRRVLELARQATTARRREVDAVAELRLQRELALNDPFNEEIAAALDDQEVRTQRAEDARLVVERARLADITRARGRTDAALAALGREEATNTFLRAVVISLRAEVVTHGGAIVGDDGEVERENYDEARWEEAGLRERQNQPRIHHDPFHIPGYEVNYPPREEWPPSYQSGRVLGFGGAAPPALMQELSNQDIRIALLELARGNLRHRIVALGGAVVGPYGEVQGEFFNERRWDQAGRQEREGGDRIHFDLVIPDSPFNPLREDWPIQFQPPPDLDDNPLRDMSHEPPPGAPDAANSDSGGEPPPSTADQRSSASGSVFSDPGSSGSDDGPPPHDAPSTSASNARPASDTAAPSPPEQDPQAPEDQGPDAPAEENPAEDEPGPPPSPGDAETPKKKRLTPGAAAKGPPRRSPRLTTVPPADYTGGTKRKNPDDGGAGGSGKRRKE